MLDINISKDASGNYKTNMNKENSNKRGNIPVSCGKPIVLIVMTYVFIIIVNNNYFISTLDINATRIKNKANGSCKSSINEKDSDYQRNNVIPMFCGKPIYNHANYETFYYNHKRII